MVPNSSVRISDSGLTEGSETFFGSWHRVERVEIPNFSIKINYFALMEG